MPITVNGTAQNRKLLEGVLDDIGRLIDETDKLPDEKKDAIRDVLDDPGWSIAVDLPFGGRLNGSTYKARKRIRVSLNTFAGGINRFRAVVFHELVHASCEGEFDAEVFECILFPPSNNLPGGGTWPGGDDLDPFDNGTAPHDGGFRESDHFIWDPATGRVWRKNPDGSRGPIVWDDPDVWDRWKTERNMSMTPADDTSRETFIDYSEPGDFGYLPLDESIVRPSKEEALTTLDRLDIETTGFKSIRFVDFETVEGDLPVSVFTGHIAKVTPDAEKPETTTVIRLSDGDVFRVKSTYADAIRRLR